jgi:flagellar protein FlaI
MVLGGTAAGKTTALNAIACLIKPGSKIITIEETAELNLSHENWVSLISRQSYGLGASGVGEVTLFDLVKTSMRHRPDIMVVGEIRGQEAYVLFQSLATGHGGMCTMHADNLDSAVKRLTQKPMNIAPAYIPLMNVVLSVKRVSLLKNDERKAFRRVVGVDEIIGYEDYVNTFKWDARKDIHNSSLSNSNMLNTISGFVGSDKEVLLDEITRRKEVLNWMRENNVRSYKDVAAMIAEYYARPTQFYKRLFSKDGVKLYARS